MPSPPPGPTGDPAVLADGTLRWEAENYAGGATAVSGRDYYDTTAGNAGGKWRAQNVDIEACSEGGYNVGWTAAGEWLAFRFTGGGTYLACVRYAAYQDADPGNLGGKYRIGGVDIESCSEGGFNVGWINAGEWTSYTFTGSGTYTADARYACLSDKRLRIEVDGRIVAAIGMQATGGWQTWRTATSGRFTVGEGAHTVRLVAESSGYNVNWLRFVPAP